MNLGIPLKEPTSWMFPLGSFLSFRASKFGLSLGSLAKVMSRAGAVDFPRRLILIPDRIYLDPKSVSQKLLSPCKTCLSG